MYQNQRNQPATIRLLYQALPASLSLTDDYGMTPLHYACQRTTDVSLVRTILSYKKDNISQTNKDGLTALDLVSRRGQVTDQSEGLFAIEPEQQANIIKLLQNNGGQSGRVAGTVARTVPRSDLHYNIPEERSSTTQPPGQSYEDHLASQVLSEFPELSGLLEQIVEGNH